MKFFDYLKSLLPIIGKDTILENLRITRGSFSTAMSALKPIAAAMQNHAFKDKYIESASKTYMYVMPSNLGAKNCIVHYVNAIPNVMANIELIETMIEGKLEESIATQSTTYKNANLIRMCDAADFALNYGITFINFAMLRETNASLGDADKQEDLPSPVVEKLMSNAAGFITVMKIFSQPVSDVRKSLEQIPEILVEDNDYDKMAKAMGKSNVDPLNLENAQNFNGNPFQAFGKWRAERANAKYRLAQETLNQLKMRLLQLQKAQEGKQDAALDRQIRATQSRIDELSRKIEEYQNAK